MKSFNSFAVKLSSVSIEISTSAVKDHRTHDASGLTFGGGHAPVALIANSKRNSASVSIYDSRTSDVSKLSFGSGMAPGCIARNNVAKVGVIDSKTVDLSSLIYGSGGHAPASVKSVNASKASKIALPDLKTQDKSGLSFGAGYAPSVLTK
jgi:hypothetical protein